VAGWRSGLAALLVAAAVVAVEVGLVWAFVVVVWPQLPPWAAMIGFIALAAFAIGSPLVWLARGGKPPTSAVSRRHRGDGD